MLLIIKQGLFSINQLPSSIDAEAERGAWLGDAAQGLPGRQRPSPLPSGAPARGWPRAPSPGGHRLGGSASRGAARRERLCSASLVVSGGGCRGPRVLCVCGCWRLGVRALTPERSRRSPWQVCIPGWAGGNGWSCWRESVCPDLGSLSACTREPSQPGRALHPSIKRSGKRAGRRSVARAPLRSEETGKGVERGELVLQSVGLGSEGRNPLWGAARSWGAGGCWGSAFQRERAKPKSPWDVLAEGNCSRAGTGAWPLPWWDFQGVPARRRWAAWGAGTPSSPRALGCPCSGRSCPGLGGAETLAGAVPLAPFRG